MDAFTLALEQAQQHLTLPPPAERRRLRRAAGLTLADLAQAVNVSAVSVHRWERGTRTPALRHVARYAGLLGVLAREVAHTHSGGPERVRAAAETLQRAIGRGQP